MKSYLRQAVRSDLKRDCAVRDLSKKKGILFFSSFIKICLTEVRPKRLLNGTVFGHES